MTPKVSGSGSVDPGHKILSDPGEMGSWPETLTLGEGQGQVCPHLL